jgi:hypothetical protein
VVDNARRAACLSAFLDDPLQDVADKIVLGRILMQSGTQADTLLLINAILYAHLRDENDLQDGLLQALADAQTPESTAALMHVITDSTAELAFEHLPANLQYAIHKALRLNPDGAMTGEMLATHYTSQGSPESAQALENVQRNRSPSITIVKTTSCTSIFHQKGQNSAFADL